MLLKDCFVACLLCAIIVNVPSSLANDPNDRCSSSPSPRKLFTKLNERNANIPYKISVSSATVIVEDESYMSKDDAKSIEASENDDGVYTVAGSLKHKKDIACTDLASIVILMGDKEVYSLKDCPFSDLLVKFQKVFENLASCSTWNGQCPMAGDIDINDLILWEYAYPPDLEAGEYSVNICFATNMKKKIYCLVLEVEVIPTCSKR